MPDRSTVLQVIETAYDFATENIDLSGCYYGSPHWKGSFVDQPYPYYFFLAGLVAQLRCSRILEIGAHFGGSIFSMARGIEHSGLAQSAEVVTVDIHDRNSEAFQANPVVVRILGDCLDDEIAQKIAQSFTGAVDLLYIDATHDYENTNRCLKDYIPLVFPHLVILDDIRLNDSMKKLWEDLSVAYGDRAIDITDCAHRNQNVGFGLLICDPLRDLPRTGGG